MLLKTIPIIASSLLITVISSNAVAHSSFVEKEFVEGKTVELTLRVPHGCDGNPTKEIMVVMPNGPYKDPGLGEAVMGIKPKMNGNWNIVKSEKGEIIPFESHGTIYNEDVRSITWKGGRLPNDFYEHFQFRVKLPYLPEGVENKKLYFPVYQQCTHHTKNEWIEIPTYEGEHLSKPAPSINILNGE